MVSGDIGLNRKVDALSTKTLPTGTSRAESAAGPPADALPLDRIEFGASAPAAPTVSTATAASAPLTAAAAPAPASTPAPSVSDVIRSSKPIETVTFVYDARGGPKLGNVALKGSFNPTTGRFDATWNGGKAIPMYDDGTNGDRAAGDGAWTVQVPLDPKDPSEFRWGAVGDVLGKDGRPVATGRWLVLTEEPPAFRLDGQDHVQAYAPVSNHLMGVHRVGEDGISFRTWAPQTGRGDLADYRMFAELFNEDGTPAQAIPLQKDESTGVWSAELAEGWGALKGKGYRYAVRNSHGELLQAQDGGKSRPVAYGDPYARYVQGPQRGLERIFVDPILGVETGWYNSSNSGGPNYEINPQWARFTVNGQSGADRVVLVLKDEQGRPLNREQLLQRLGEPRLVPYDQASAEQKRNVDVLRAWKIDTSSPVTAYKWIDHVNPDGSIDMDRVGNKQIGNAWVTAVNNFPALVGLSYEFQAYENGRLVGDVNADGVLQDGERKKTFFNDPYGNVISARPGGERLSLVRESSYQFQHDNVPRKETDPKKFVIYEAHVGSFMSTKDNQHASTFKDLVDHLDYIEAMGANTVEIMPVDEFGSTRDWGYTCDFLFAGANAYGFDMPRDEAVKRGLIDPSDQQGQETVFISGTDAFKFFVDEAHRRGLNVMSDVVYNHVSGRPDAENPLSAIDGDKSSFFKWWGQYKSQTPWGDKPAFDAPGVKEYFTNNAAQQLQEFHVDGMRFDFVQVLHDTGTVDEKREGMNALRQINRTVQFLKPGAYTVAEDFTENWLVAADLDKSEWQGEGNWRMEKRGMGFGGVWNGPFHHKLLGAADGSKADYNMDALMGALLGHYGVSSPEKAVFFSHSHDEVGNTGNWILRAAAHSVREEDVLQAYPRSVGRTAAAITITSAGVPMIWQGEEQLANNDFKHGMPGTWGTDTRWMDFKVTPDRLDAFKRMAALPGEQKAAEKARLPEGERGAFEHFDKMSPEERKQAEVWSQKAGMYRLYRDVIHLRTSTPDLSAGTPIARLYTHNLDRVMAYQRGEGGGLVVVSNFADVERSGYKVNLPAGRYQVVLNTDDREYGGSGKGTHGFIDGGQGLTLPAGGTLVLKKVG